MNTTMVIYRQAIGNEEPEIAARMWELEACGRQADLPVISGLQKRTFFGTMWKHERIVKRLPAFFYELPSGHVPVREWIRSLDAADRKIIGEDIKDVEFSWPIGMPLVRALGAGLWEVRSSLTQGRIARVFFCINGGRMVLLHGFIKKTQKAPQSDLNLALKRKKEIT